MKSSGAISYFSYSGGLVCTPERLGVQTVVKDGIEINFCSPIRLGDGGWRPIPRFTPASFEKEFPSVKPIPNLFGFAAHPSFGEDGTPAINLSNEHAAVDDLPRDTIPIIIEHSDWERMVPVAEALIRDALARLRIRSGQWWVGRSSESLTGNHHISFEIFGEQINFDSVRIACSQTRPFEGSVRISPEIWQEVWDEIRSGVIPHNYSLLISDSEYFYVLKEFRISLIILATAFESARDMMADRLGINFNGTNLISHLSTVLERKAGRNVEKELPEEFEFLKSIWIARGHLAHGQQLFWKDKGVIFGSEPAEYFFRPAHRLLNWIATIEIPPHRSG